MAVVGTIEPDHIALASIGNGPSVREFLRDSSRPLSAAGLAQRIHVPANRVSQIVAGKRDITANSALRLGRWFGTGPNIWLDLQKAYELDLARQE